MSYGYFSKFDHEVVRVFQIHEHHAKIVKLGRYAIGTVAFEEMFEIAIRVLVKGQIMTMTSCSHKSSCTHYDKSNYQFLSQNLQNFL